MAPDEFTQDNRLLAISTPLGKDVLLINDVMVSESISSLFVLEAGLLSPLAKSGKVSGDKLIGKEASVRVTPASGRPRVFHGIISRFAEAGRDQRFVTYQCQIVPWLWLLTLSSNCRIFQNKSAPDIIQSIFDDARYAEFQFRKDFSKLNRAGYTTRDYCVEYRETDFNFVSRLMEEEGIFYFFRHEGDGNLETSKHTMVLADTLENLDECPGQPSASFLPAVPAAQERSARVTSWQLVHALRPGKVTLRDYHFELSDVPQHVTKSKPAEVAGPAAFEVYDYPGDYAEKFNDTGQRLGEVHKEGEKLVAVRLEEELMPHKTFNGGSTCPAFAPGFLFQLANHSPRMDGKYLLTAVQHTAVQSPPYISGVLGHAPYHNAFSCIAATSSFRPPRVTPKPVVQGVQTAEVSGPKDAGGKKYIEDIHSDAYGRVKVIFHWDRAYKSNVAGEERSDAQNSSCWLRVAQSWAGKGFGAIFTPRCGDEVVVAFLEGDPDRPLIVGSVYNNRHQRPYTLPEHKTRSGVKTRSSKEGNTDNFNEIYFEDERGNEVLHVHAERTLSTVVEGSESRSVGGSRSTSVGEDDKHHVKNHLTVDVDEGNYNTTVTKGVMFTNVPNAQYHVHAKKIWHISEEEITLDVHGCTIRIDPGSITLSAKGSKIVLDAAGISINGKLVNINC